MDDRYRRGAHSVHDIKYHFVWKTKYGYVVLCGELSLRLRQILREICASQNLQIVSGNVRKNHVHMAISASPDISPSKIAQLLKGKSSYRLQREFRELQKKYWGQHLWGRGFFCPAVGVVSEELFRQYVENQAEDEGEFKVWDSPQRSADLKAD